MAAYRIHIGDGARVEESLVVGRDAYVQELHLHTRHIVDLPVVRGRHVLLAAFADRWRVAERKQDLLAKNVQAIYEPPNEPPGPQLDTALAEEIAQAERVIVYWSRHALDDAYVASALAFAAEVGERRYGHAVRGGFLEARRLDGSPLPMVLTGRQRPGAASAFADDPLFVDLGRLSHAAFDDLLRDLGHFDHVAGPREAHAVRTNELFELVAALDARDQLEAAVSQRLATDVRREDAAHPEHAQRALVRALVAREPDATAAPAVLLRLGVRRPERAQHWDEIVPALDVDEQRRLVEWARPLAELDDEPKCLARIELMLLFCGLERPRLWETATVAGVEARLDDRPVDDWVSDLVARSARSNRLGAWLGATAMGLTDAERHSLAWFDVRDRWEAVARRHDRALSKSERKQRRKVRPAMRWWVWSPTEELPPVPAAVQAGPSLVDDLERNGRWIEATLDRAWADVNGPPWRWRRGASTAYVLRAQLADLPEQSGDPLAFRYETDRILAHHRERSWMLRSGATAATFGVGSWLPLPLGVLAAVGWWTRTLLGPLVTLLYLVGLAGLGLRGGPNPKLELEILPERSEDREARLAEEDVEAREPERTAPTPEAAAAKIPEAWLGPRELPTIGRGSLRQEEETTRRQEPQPPAVWLRQACLTPGRPAL